SVLNTCFPAYPTCVFPTSPFPCRPELSSELPVALSWLGYVRRTGHDDRRKAPEHTTYGPPRHEVRHLPRPVPSRRREPHSGHLPRRGTARMARLARLRRGLDRRAPLRRLGADRAAGTDHRRGG